jgi:hypothetical protein
MAVQKAALMAASKAASWELHSVGSKAGMKALMSVEAKDLMKDAPTAALTVDLKADY